MTKGLITTKKIGVLMGGTSAERDVSVRSGLAIYQALQEQGYNSALIDVGKDIVNVLKKEKVRVAFLALHGGTGEDGSIQGLLEVLGISYTGSGVLASALAMDKEASKKIFSYHGFPVAPYVVVHRKSKAKGKKTVDNTLPQINFPLPWVIKPASEGSSLGVNIIKKESMLEQMLEKTFQYGRRAIIEKFIEGREVHIAVLGSRVLGGVEVRPSLEFYNYEAKYTSGLTEYIIPPQIDDEIYEKTKGIAYSAHTALGCSGASRVDFRIDGSGTPYVLEVNTLPGMTATSLLPKIAGFAGINFNDLIQEILKVAVKEA
jgi:D-alanine-D-alanine ligase